MPAASNKEPITLAVGLGANLPNEGKSPIETLKAVRPKLEKAILDWLLEFVDDKSNCEINSENIRWRWSPLYETDPAGGPKGQPPYINAVLVVDGQAMRFVEQSERNAISLLEQFRRLEDEFGRTRDSRKVKWGPRSLDIDLLAWGELQVKNKNLTIPHPRLVERSFVIIPLGQALNMGSKPPKRVQAQNQWPE